MTSPNTSGSARRLAAILSADVAGYARLMDADEEHTFARLGQCRELLMKRIGQHGGRVANTAGDAVLAEFTSAVDAVRCAIAAQEEFAVANSTVPKDRRLEFRIGLHVGDVIEQAGDLFGDGVNIAARLQSLAEPGGIVLSGSAFDQVRKIVSTAFVDMGRKSLKNIADPVQAFAVAPVRSTTVPRYATRRSSEAYVAVLPFNNMSSDPGLDHFADGITEDIITALSKAKWFSVIARNSSFTFRGRAVDIRDVGRELGARYVLEGSVRSGGNRLRITGQLIEAESGKHVWAEKFEGSTDNVFDLQDHVTERIVLGIEPSLRAAEVVLAQAKPADDLTAYDQVLRVIPANISEMTRDVCDTAIAALESALSTEPGHRLAQTSLMSTLNRKFGMGWCSEPEIARALALADNVARSRVDDPQVLAAAGAVIANMSQGRQDDGFALTEHAYALNRNSAFVLARTAVVCLQAGRPELTLERYRRLQRIAPLAPATRFVASYSGIAQIQLGLFQDALADALTAAKEAPMFSTAHRVAASSLANLGRLDEARDSAMRLMSVEPEFRVGRIRASGVGIGDSKFGYPYINGLLAAGLPE